MRALHPICSNSPHILPLSMEPGLQDRKALLLSRDFGSATIICDDTWKLDNGCLASVRFRRLVNCSSVRRSLFWLATSIESFLDCGKGMLAGKVEKREHKAHIAYNFTQIPNTAKLIALPVMLKKIWIFWSLVGPLIFRCLLMPWNGLTAVSRCCLDSCLLPVAKPVSKYA